VKLKIEFNLSKDIKCYQKS